MDRAEAGSVSLGSTLGLLGCFLVHVIVHEDARTKAMILLAYDGALRREELMSLQVRDIDWARGIITIQPRRLQELDAHATCRSHLLCSA